MPYQEPTYNLTCNIFTSGVITDPPRVTNAPCNIAWGKRVNVPSTGGTGFVGIPLMTLTLLLPSEVDIRGSASVGGFDAVEVPAFSGRYYICVFADFIGQGFDNEHRGAVLQQRAPFETQDV